ncbi:SLAP domain-containing protein [Companilactobacillus baiquanensis]|uniref:SLAP domain-containing protein n=1 Tax=Companilactobacillus baiquanensis TaxID=2486005 RepID=A0ABW1UVV4_9LACO|nr:SLAP domain-containing protein [Companilactobacillus baiquanensis]
MKKSLLCGIAIVSALAMGTTAVQASDTTDNGDYAITDENGNSITNTLDLDNFGVTVTSNSAQLYDINGNEISASLNEGTSWQTDNERYIDGTVYYRVSTDGYVNSSDVYLYKPINEVIQAVGDKPVVLYNNQGQLIKNSNRALAPGSTWRTDRIITVDHISYYRVSTNEFAVLSDISLVN